MSACLRNWCLILISITAVQLIEDTAMQWQCDNGELIDLSYKCDRTFHCKDYSDETFWNCLPQKFELSDQFTYCTYGAILEKTMQCNGITECVDGSDELPAKCIETYLDELHNTWRGNCRCRLHSMKCKPGECIPNERVCDGHRDCSNGKDETFELCGHQICTERNFRCGYGACIDAKKVCDETYDCADRSDELLDSPECNRNETLLLKRPHMYIYIEKKLNHCYIPPHNRLIFHIFNGYEAIVVRNISYMPVDTIVSFSCAPGYLLFGANETACGLNETWMVALPTCERYCELKEDLSLRMACRNSEGMLIDCRPQVLPGTVVTIDCAYNYQMPKDNTFQANVTCLESGEFNAKLQRCLPGCGEILDEPIVAGHMSRTPWLVALYGKSSQYEPIEFQCVGTIVDPYWILTAAHCVENVILVNAIANKQYKDFCTRNDEYDYLKVPKSELRVIVETIPHSDYVGEKFNFNFDVALIRVSEPYIYSNFVLPLCTISRFHSTAPTIAKFSAWGLNNEISTNLANISDFTADSAKFKLQLLDGAEATHGDSGSGVFLEKDQIKYLQGVLSRGSAEVDVNVTVTNLNHKKILDFLRKYLPDF